MSYRLFTFILMLLSLIAHRGLADTRTTSNGELQWRAGLQLEYSSYLDGHGLLGRTRDDVGAFPLGQVLFTSIHRQGFGVGLRLGQFGLGDVFQSDIYGEYAVSLGKHVSLPIQLGMGFIYAGRQTLIPLMSDAHVSWLTRLLIGVSVKISPKWAIDGTLSLYVLPHYTTYTYPIGGDLRWSLGLSYMF